MPGPYAGTSSGSVPIELSSPVTVTADQMQHRPLPFHGNATLVENRATGAVTATMSVEGPSGKALLFIRMYERTGDPAYLDAATERLSVPWTPVSHNASAYAYTMQFNYGQQNSQPVAGFIAGSPVQNPALLSNITVSNQSGQIKEYLLSYHASGVTGRELLDQVQECAQSTNACLINCRSSVIANGRRSILCALIPAR